MKRPGAKRWQRVLKKARKVVIAATGGGGRRKTSQLQGDVNTHGDFACVSGYSNFSA